MTPKQIKFCFTRALLLLSLLFLGSCASVPARCPASLGIPSRTRDTSGSGYYFEPAGLADDYPVQGFGASKLRRDFKVLQETGARFYRFGMSWAEIERSRGHYDWARWDRIVAMAEKYGITLVPYVCYTPQWANQQGRGFWHDPPKDLSAFGHFMGMIASRYRGKILSWELWNEPDNPDYWTGTADQYARMIHFAAAQVREADPGAKIVLGGMANGRSAFVERLLQRDQVGNDVDVINIHGYLETWSSDRAEAYPRRIQAMHQLVEETAPTRDLWMAEFGYSDHRFSGRKTSVWGIPIAYRYEHTAKYQAAELWRDHLLALGTGELSLTTWYRIHDLPASTKVIGDENNRFLGLLDVKGHPKPAFYAFKLYNELLGEPVRSILPELRIRKKAGSQSVVRAFKREDGNLIVSAWLRSSDPSEIAEQSGLAVDRRHEKIRITLPVKYSSGRWTELRYDLHGDVLDTAALKDGRISVSLSPPHVFIAEIRPTGRSSESTP